MQKEKEFGEMILNQVKPVIAKIGRYGPMVQIGEKDDEEKPKFASH